MRLSCSWWSHGQAEPLLLPCPKSDRCPRGLHKTPSAPLLPQAQGGPAVRTTDLTPARPWFPSAVSPGWLCDPGQLDSLSVPVFSSGCGNTVTF